MQSTSVTLLMRLKQDGAQDDWTRFVKIYTPLLFHWVCRFGVNPGAAPDIVQDLFVRLVRELPTFEYNPANSFRSWLFTITKRHCIDHARALKPAVQADPDLLNQLADPDQFNLEEEEYQGYLVQRALRVIKTDFQPTTWQAFWMFVVEQKSAMEISKVLGITVRAAYLAKVRVMKRLQADLEGLLH